MTIENGNFIVYHYDLPSPIYGKYNLLSHRDFKFNDTDINLIASFTFSCQNSIIEFIDAINKTKDAIARLKEVIDKLNVDNLPIKFNLKIEGSNDD